MRVLETALPPKKYTMPGKKKHKIRKQCPDNDPNLSDSSDECGEFKCHTKKTISNSWITEYSLLAFSFFRSCR